MAACSNGGTAASAAASPAGLDGRPALELRDFGRPAGPPLPAAVVSMLEGRNPGPFPGFTGGIRCPLVEGPSAYTASAAYFCVLVSSAAGCLGAADGPCIQRSRERL